MTKIIINPKAAEREGIHLDQLGWPTPQSLKNWHEKNNPGNHLQRGTRITEKGETAAKQGIQSEDAK